MVVPAAPRWRYTGDGWLLRVIAARPQPPLPAPLLLLAAAAAVSVSGELGAGKSIQEGVPATRAGTPTARSASTRKMDSPVQDAYPAASTWEGDMISGVWSALKYSPPNSAHTPLFTACAASATLRAPCTSCGTAAHISGRHASSWLVEAGVGQHVVQEQRPRHLARPGLRGARGQGQVGVGRQLVAAHARTVRMGHVSLQESHASALLVGL
eukprot:CAMPEP_0202871184 /NCGR_PEP_ID=MMETSP1391-20130828/18023_1 /ASSEMBLY_ACC=CAM_ASM_000867 /TAXON_ID=1034604 /ORGANISM="Chlamydomonas leiostraca, Strain SAG 11-49" /LENGTH=211 /DNA_ID=CAMNT_0049551915 /DNA_START=817 /DNA_END=1452 /DNA_ORIENTATION=-